jgi:hypothetical protein
MHFLHAINSDRRTRLLNVFGQIAMFWEINKNFSKDGILLSKVVLLQEIRANLKHQAAAVIVHALLLFV